MQGSPLDFLAFFNDISLFFYSSLTKGERRQNVKYVLYKFPYDIGQAMDRDTVLLEKLPLRYQTSHTKRIYP